MNVVDTDAPPSLSVSEEAITLALSTPSVEAAAVAITTRNAEATAADAAATAADRAAVEAAQADVATKQQQAAASEANALTYQNAAAASAAGAAVNDTAGAAAIWERVGTYDPAASTAQVAASVNRGVENRPAASAGQAYFRIGLLKSTALTGVASFTRAGSATGADQSGVVATYASGAPRVNTAGYLAEVGSTNLALQSAALNNTTAWFPQQATTPAANQIAFTADATSRAFQSWSLAGPTPITLSATFSAADVGKKVRLAIWDSTRNGLSSGASPDLVIPASGFVSFTWPSVTALSNVAILNGSAGVAQTLTLAANAGFQAEALAFPTSYIPTTTAPASRNPDIATETVNIPVGQAFTVKGVFIAPPVAASSPVIFELLPGANANDRLMAYCSGGAVRLNNSSAGLAATDPFGGFSDAYTPGAPVGVAISVSGSTVTWSVNGGAAHTATLPGGAFSQALTRLAKACRVIGTQQLNSTLRQLDVIDRAFSAAELAAASDVSLERDLDFTTQTYKYLGQAYSSITELPGTTFQRAGTATVVTLAGYTLSVASGGLRVSDAGLTVEPGRTNVLLQSRTLSAWTNLNCTVTSGQAAPDGASTAYNVANTAGVSSSLKAVVGTIPNSTAYTASILAKAVSGTGVIALSYGGGAVTYTGTFNLGTGVATGAGAQMVQLGSTGWYLCSLSLTTDATGTPSNVLDVYVGAFGATATPTTVTLVDGQFEAGSNATGRITTTSASATRSADTLVTTEANPSAFTLLAEFTAPALPPSGSQAMAWSWDDGSANNQVHVYVDAGGTCWARVANGGVDQALLNLGAAVVGSVQKVALAVAANDFAASRNGGAVVADASGTVPSLTTFRFGRGVTSSGYFGPGLRKIKRWRGRRTNAQLMADAA